MSQPMGIMASFSDVVFKKDGAEVFTAKVVSGGCFGPDADAQVVNRGFQQLQKAIGAGSTPAAANDFNTVALRGFGAEKEFSVAKKGLAGIEAADLKPLKP